MPSISQLSSTTNPQSTVLLPGQEVSGKTVSYTPANIATAMGIGSAAYLSAGGVNGAVVADALGNLSPQAFISQGTVTARTFAVRGSDSVNVADFGATLDGKTDDSAAFQAAYNAVPSGGTVYIPTGNLNTQINTTMGKSVHWCAMGRLDAGAAAPGTNPVLSIGDGDVFEGMLGNSKFFSKDIYTNITASYATVRIDTNNYANTGSGGAAASLSVNATQHGGSNAAGMYAINAQSYVSGTTEAPASAWGNVCISASLWVNSPKAGNSIAHYAAIYDTYGDSSGMTTCEFDYFGVGADPIGGGGPIQSGRAVVLAGCGPEAENGPMTECGRGYSIGTRATGAIGVGYYASGNFYSSVFDASDAIFLTTDLSGNAVHGAGLRLGPSQPIDFCGIYATKQFNYRTLQWNESSGNLEYQVGGTAVFGITDAGQLSLSNGYNITGNATINALSGSATGSLLTLSAPSDLNGAGMLFVGNGNTTPNKTIRVQNGYFQILNSLYSATIFQLDDSGNMNNVQSITVTSPATAPDQVPQWIQVQNWVTANFQPKT